MNIIVNAESFLNGMEACKPINWVLDRLFIFIKLTTMKFSVSVCIFYVTFCILVHIYFAVLCLWGDKV